MKFRFIFHFICLFGLIHCSILADVSSYAGKLLITEVSPKATIDWIELFVKDGSVDWSGCRLHRGSTTYAFTIPSIWITNGLTTGDYIVIHFTSGTDDNVKGDNNPGYWDGYASVSLQGTDYIIQVKEPSGSTKRVDALIWSNDNGSFTSSVIQANEAVSDGMWNGYDFSSGDAGAWTDSDDIGSGSSIARYVNLSGSGYVDTNHKNDWYLCDSPTKGSLNDAALPLTLCAFQATIDNDGIKIMWSTESEIDVHGFFILRSRSEYGYYSRINTLLIPGYGNCSTLNEYQYIDWDIETGIQYWYQLQEVGVRGQTQLHGPIQAKIEDEHPTKIDDSSISNYPNPFNPETIISYRISGDVLNNHVQIKIYNVVGKGIKTLIDAKQTQGRFEVKWDGCDQSGREVSCGIYVCQMVIGNKIFHTRKLLKLK